MTTLQEALPSLRASILVVEDEFLVRMLVSDELRAGDFHVIEARDADEAVDILASGIQVYLIFSDVRMPGMRDGLGLHALVQRRYPRIPMIITSGHLHPDTTFDDGTAFLPKPYRIANVLRLIKTRLGAGI